MGGGGCGWEGGGGWGGWEGVDGRVEVGGEGGGGQVEMDRREGGVDGRVEVDGMELCLSTDK